MWKYYYLANPALQVSMFLKNLYKKPDQKSGYSWKNSLKKCKIMGKNVRGKIFLKYQGLQI